MESRDRFRKLIGLTLLVWMWWLIAAGYQQVNEAGMHWLTTYAGLAMLATFLVEWLKNIIKGGWFDGKEQLFALLIVPAAGAAAKYFKMAYEETPWDAHLVTCVLIGAAGAGFLHDNVLNPLLKGKNGNGKPS